MTAKISRPSFAGTDCVRLVVRKLNPFFRRQEENRTELCSSSKLILLPEKPHREVLYTLSSSTASVSLGWGLTPGSCLRIICALGVEISHTSGGTESTA